MQKNVPVFDQENLSKKTRHFVQIMTALSELDIFLYPGSLLALELKENDYQVLNQFLWDNVIRPIAEKENVTPQTIHSKITRSLGLKDIRTFNELVTAYFLLEDNTLMEIALRTLPNKNNKKKHDNDYECLLNLHKILTQRKKPQD
ncbi:MAG: hypothetical protein ACPL5F_03770 [Moorellaceae bacterium]